mmetsp:Transcript_17294/g.39959  ORF Transcript_17294/g.39959 Transcript_17294/m.39959 type:complete len:405 (+) Transcript_17294:362-1576(+)|eukprot:CAMPEP_0197179960 /NCGR_PEP_ID=MMETSP1423-20130617/4741_1 /TAXON_ID=476441 /ORGANISM="Pseudo-nitzschia heimii, Strain UNC1101" /LENGTH=404 /DNA_ID=CAMNT_0042629971 /DNA_START=284 /DNA_END=1498 /DNA_ORIENTATION=+
MSSRRRQRRRRRVGSDWRTLLKSITTILLLAISATTASVTTAASSDNYNVTEGNESMLVSLGRFWSAEQAFELYAPGVVEVVTGYAVEGVPPSYNFQVILIEYDPTKTSYEVLVDYAYHNMDPFDGTGQFCDRGSIYAPAIFYETVEEFEIANDVLAEILDMKNWTIEEIKVQILERTAFYQADEYNQDYYIKNPSEFSDFNDICKRSDRLKQVWGLLQYSCYHDHDHICFIYDEDVSEIYYGENITGINVTDGVPSVVNANGEIVAIKSNIKGRISDIVSRLPQWAHVMIALIVPMVISLILIFGVTKCRAEARKTGQWKVGVVQEQQRLEQERKRKQEDAIEQQRLEQGPKQRFGFGFDFELGREEKKQEEYSHVERSRVERAMNGKDSEAKEPKDENFTEQ